MKLRPYQQNAVKKMMWSLSLNGNDLVVMPQGSGKSHVIAGFVDKLKQPILILVPNKELLEQDLDKLKMVIPEKQIGIFSASMNSKEVKRYTLATIQSAYKHPDKFAHYQVVIVDEADLIAFHRQKSMYSKFFRAIGDPKVYGLTATPYRQEIIYERWGKLSWQLTSVTTTKMINRMKPFFWSRMLVVLNTADLLETGYLSPIEYHDLSLMEHRHIPTNKSKSDFDLSKFDDLLSDRYLELASKIKNLPHKSMIVYCSSITQANRLQSLIPNSVVVTSKTSKKARNEAVLSFRRGDTRVLLNVGIYTLGFDYPELEAIVLLRPTRSLRLHCQILGRVSRIADGKTKGHVYDFVSNVKSLGKLADIVVERVGYPRQMWNVTSPAFPNGFHYAELYKFKHKEKV